MRYVRPLSTYKKLFLSYLLTVCSIICLLSSLFYSVFMRLYNEQVSEVNFKVIEQQKSSIEIQYLKNVYDLYLKITSQDLNPCYETFEWFLEHSYEGHHTDVLKVYEYLCTVLLNYPQGTIAAIHLYFPGSDLLISTRHGVHYLDQSNPDDARTFERILKNGSAPF